MYIYTAVIYIPSMNNITDASVLATETANQADFEAVGKPTAILITNIEVAETNFIIEKTYAELKAFIVAPLAWTDVRYTSTNAYTLYLVTENPL